MIRSDVKRWKRLPGVLMVVTLAVMLGTGCASTGSSGEESSDRPDRLSRDQIASVDVSNLYDVVQRLRPRWLRTQQRSFSRETRIVVVQNGTVIGEIGILRNMSPSGVTELRYMDGDTAAATLVGARSGFIEGAIIIERG